MYEFMDDGHQLEVRLKNRIIASIPPLWKRVDGVEKRIQDIVNIDTFEPLPNRFITAEHFPKAFAEHVMIPNALSAQTRSEIKK